MTPNVATCLLVSKVLVADGMVTDAERSFLADLMTRLGLTEAERQGVIDLEGWDEADAIVAAMPREERQAIIELLVDAASADGRLSALEHATVVRLTAALRLDAP